MSQITDHGTERLAAALAPEFRVLRLLGEGGVARVYLAGETSLERLVAVKVLRVDLASDEVARLRFLREARAAARVRHLGIPTIHRVGELESGSPYLVMEYVEGLTLADLLAAKPALEGERARSILRQLAAALAAAHEQRIVHRDVRPRNILIERGTGRAVLTDFGIAGILESGSEIVTRLTRSGQLLGDPRYLSPERLRGEATTPGADCYALACVAYEMLTGAGPYGPTDGRPLRDIVALHLEGTPLSLAVLRPDVPTPLSDGLLRCLAQKPEQRPDAAELTSLLEAPPPEGAPRLAMAAEPPFFPALASFLHELRRRRVYRTAVAYLAASFVLLQGLDMVLRAVPAHAWTYGAAVSLALGGFPVAIVLTWVFDVTRSGIRRTPEVPATDALARSPLSRALLMALGLTASALLAGTLAWWLLR